MVYYGTKIAIADNTGAQTVKVLHVYGMRQAAVGSILLTVLRKKKKLKIFVKKKINFVFLFARKRPFFRKKGFYYVRLLYSKGILLNADQEKILGTRHFGYLTFESKKAAFVQLLRSCRCLI